MNYFQGAVVAGVVGLTGCGRGASSPGKPGATATSKLTVCAAASPAEAFTDLESSMNSAPGCFHHLQFRRLQCPAPADRTARPRRCFRLSQPA